MLLARNHRLAQTAFTLLKRAPIASQLPKPRHTVLTTPNTHLLLRLPSRYFSQDATQPAEEVLEAQEAAPEVVTSNVEQRQFQAETKRLLDIVAKSIYTDKEVFIRELLSNCSDALEKQKLAELRGEVRQSAEGNALRIEVSTNDKERTITLFDTGIGMSR